MLWHGICTLNARFTSIRTTRARGQPVFVARTKRYVGPEVPFDKCIKNRPGENMRTASKTILTTLGLALVALGPTLAWGAAAPAPPVPNKGDTAWMLTSTALVLQMSVPAHTKNNNNQEHTKNKQTEHKQVFVVFSLITVLWCVYGYSLAVTE